MRGPSVVARTLGGAARHAPAGRALIGLCLGLVLFGADLWLGLMAELGVGPWDVLTGGLAHRFGTPFGRTAIALLFALGIGPAVQVAFGVSRQTLLRRPVEAPA